MDHSDLPEELNLLRSLDHDLTGDPGFVSFPQFECFGGAGGKADHRHFSRDHVTAFIQTRICDGGKKIGVGKERKGKKGWFRYVTLYAVMT